MNIMQIYIQLLLSSVTSMSVQDLRQFTSRSTRHFKIIKISAFLERKKKMDLREISEKFLSTIVIIHKESDLALFNLFSNHFVRTLGISLNISSISSLPDSPQLSNLLLRLPNLKEFPYSLISKLTRKLESLTIESTKLKEIRYNFVDHQSLEELRIEAPLVFIYNKLFYNIPLLKELKLRNAKLKKLPRSLIHLQRLETLELKNCHLSEIPSIIFYLANLKNLSLQKNSIKKIPQGIKSLQTLENLDLSENMLREVPSFFTEMSSLQFLNCSNNNFQQFPYIIFHIPHLNVFDFKENTIKNEEHIRNINPDKELEINSNYDVVYFTEQQMKIYEKAKAKEFNEKQIPHDLCCPISKSVFIDPVILVQTGETYERRYIEKWIKKHDTDPLTNQLLHDKQLCPNISIRRLILNLFS